MLTECPILIPPQRMVNQYDSNQRLLNPVKKKQITTNKRSNGLMANFEWGELWMKPVLSIKRKQSEINKVGVSALTKGILIYGTFSRGIHRKIYFSAEKAIRKYFQRCTSASAMHMFLSFTFYFPCILATHLFWSSLGKSQPCLFTMCCYVT